MRTGAVSTLIARARRGAAVVRLRPFDTATTEGRSRERYRRIILATTSGLLARAISALASLASVPMLLTYLGKEQFGLWSAIMALVAWLGLLDLGISTALVNALAEAHGKEDRTAAARYAATAAAMLIALTATGAVLLAIAGPRISWESVLGVAGEVPSALVNAAVVAAATVLLASLPLAVVQSCYVGYQALYMANVFSACGSVVTVVAIWLSIRMRATLWALILGMGAAGVGVSALSFLVLTHRLLPWLSFRLSYVSQSAARRLSRTSVPMFLFQVGALAVNQSQLIILGHIGTLATVAEYAILLRIIQILSGLIILSTNAFAPSYREAAERGDAPWVGRSFRRALWLRMGLAGAGGIILVAYGNQFVSLWLRRSDVGFEPTVWIGMAVFIAAATWVNAHSDLLTALDRIWVQVGLVMVNGMVTIALTVLLTPRYGVLGTLTALGFTTVAGWTWLFPVIARPLLEKRA